MKRNSLTILIILGALASCSKKAPHSLAERWSQLHPTSKIAYLERKLASSHTNMCMSDVYSIETLKEEIAELEKNIPPGTSVEGYWKHLDLSKLPTGQANFLKEFGDKIGDLKNPDSIDFSKCNDLPCIINTVYGKEDFIGGYVHYIWYLKFGSLLSVDNLVPRQQGEFKNGGTDKEGSNEPGEYNGKFLPLQKFLYKENELYGFWRLSHLLKNTPLTTIKKAKEIQRIPHDESLISYPNSCGLAYEKWVLLTDGCLQFWGEKYGDPFYEKVTHEMSHQLDFQLAAGSQYSAFSQTDEYLDIAGYIRKDHMENDVRVYKIEPKEGAKIVTEYAKASIAENFAETFAYYRLDGDRTKTKTSPEHYSYMGKNFFDSRSFEKEEIIKRWVDENRTETERAVLQVVMDCDKSGQKSSSAYFSKSDFKVPVASATLNCYSNGAFEISQLIRAKISIEEAEGCGIIKNQYYKPKWDMAVKGLLVSSFERYLVEMQNDKDYLARVQNFYKEVEDEAVALNSYLSCYGRNDEEACYGEGLQRNAFEKASALALNETITGEMASLYVSQYPYSKMSVKTQKFYQSLVSSNLEGISDAADSIWQSCSSNDDDSVAPRGKYFTLSSGYLVSSFYNCINRSIPEELKRFVRSVGVEQFKAQHPGEELIMTSFALPELVRSLQDKYVAERKLEKDRAVEFTFSDEGKIRSTILSNLSWVRKGSRGNEIVSECLKKANQAITFKPLYHLKTELFSEYVQGSVCSNLESSKEFKELRETENFVSQQLDRSESRLRDAADKRARDCLDRYPIGGLFNKVRHRFSRESCLKDNWEELELKVYNEMKAELAGQKKTMNLQEIKDRLDSSRRKVQQDTIGRYFAIF